MYVWLGQFQKRFLLLLFFKWTLWEKRFCGGKNNFKKSLDYLFEMELKYDAYIAILEYFKNYS